MLSFVSRIAAAKIPLPRPITSVYPRKTLTALSLLSSPMEVEVKMRLANANAHRYVTALLSPTPTPTASELSVRRIVLCLHFYGYDECCVASLKARAVLVDGVSRVEEDPCCLPPERERESEKRERKREKRDKRKK